MPRQNDHITSRQRQSQRIMRDKIAKKRRENLRRRAKFIVTFSAVVIAVFAGGFLWYSKNLLSISSSLEKSFFAATASSGLIVRSLHIEGRSRTPMADIERALNVRKNDPILGLSLDEMREKLKSVQSIREAAVERVLPDALYVRIVEREPVALWQHGGGQFPVDDQGVVMQGVDSALYGNLPIIVGDAAPQHVGELMSILAVAPDLAGNFRSAIYVSNRRWNIRMARNIEIKLPEKSAAAAFSKFAAIEKDSELLKRDVKVIDLRIPGKMFIKLAPNLVMNQGSVSRNQG